MNMIILGAPGAGKGTISKMLVEDLNMVQISTGDILRKAIKDGTELGKKANDYIINGDLVPDEVVLDIIKERLIQPDCENGYILDGFPRTIPQAEGLKDILKSMDSQIDLVLNIKVDEMEIIKRLTSRRTCVNSTCQAIYNVISKPTKVENVCDICGSEVKQRDDETEEVIRQRLKTYNEKTSPLLVFYKVDGLIQSIDGNRPPEDVFKDVKAAVQ